MGLDVSVHVHVVRIADYVDGEWLGDYDIVVMPDYERYWPGRSYPLQVGYYSSERERGFHAGGYSAYNRWRNWLAKAAGYDDARHVWDHVVSGPFVELIDFSDCEGVLGTEVCRKLFSDFCDPQVLVRAEGVIRAEVDRSNVFGGNREWEWFIALYNNFKKAFEVAGERNGVVAFH